VTDRLTLGVDPGKSGALAWLDGDGALVHLADMPDAQGHALGALVRDLIVEWRPAVAWVELVASRPGQSAPAMWRFGRDYGAVLGSLGAFDVPVEHVTPATWKRAARLSRDKGESRQRAVETWPAWSDSFSRAKDDGRAEAALIARHGWMKGH